MYVFITLLLDHLTTFDMFQHHPALVKLAKTMFAILRMPANTSPVWQMTNTRLWIVHSVWSTTPMWTNVKQQSILNPSANANNHVWIKANAIRQAHRHSNVHAVDHGQVNVVKHPCPHARTIRAAKATNVKRWSPPITNKITSAFVIMANRTARAVAEVGSFTGFSIKILIVSTVSLLLDTVPNPCLAASTEQEQYYSFAFSSHAYVQCNGDLMHLQPCATGLYWNQDEKICDHEVTPPPRPNETQQQTYQVNYNTAPPKPSYSRGTTSFVDEDADRQQGYRYRNYSPHTKFIDQR